MARERMKQTKTGLGVPRERVTNMPRERVTNRAGNEPERRAERAPTPRRTEREE
jgi:hypothetical protein